MVLAWDNFRFPSGPPVCRELDITPSTYYRHQQHRLYPARRSLRAQSDDQLKPEIQRIYDENHSVIAQFIQKFEAEFRDYPVRLNLPQLTIIFDRPECPVPMSRTGGCENHLAYHLSALLVLLSTGL
ncbi:TPA: DUF3732 domain-containing protein [Klebsiella pneumoniae]|nr:DUF3732 domain-containing protein [Klebsiella pneumoniae]HBS6078908.1 DUF3732 domain-containing protein [Klebsiella pneumoniae]HDK6219408.1 DUF3732 domain-containing protein [Klebsiella pneumoniae]HDU2754267.1 DUF3732 domain-containing protein [Klebsiella pneumoniae]HDY8717768.1 DUF3732 domain-containing protein [Klebsiella pneumoniae]